MIPLLLRKVLPVKLDDRVTQRNRPKLLNVGPLLEVIKADVVFLDSDDLLLILKVPLNVWVFLLKKLLLQLPYIQVNTINHMPNTRRIFRQVVNKHCIANRSYSLLLFLTNLLIISSVVNIPVFTILKLAALPYTQFPKSLSVWPFVIIFVLFFDFSRIFIQRLFVFFKLLQSFFRALFQYIGTK